MRILASIKHPNVISYKEAFIDHPSSTLWYLTLFLQFNSLIMDFAENSDLYAEIVNYQK